MSETNASWGTPEPAITPMQHTDLAGFWIRFLAHICDGITIFFVILPFEIVAGITSGGTRTFFQVVGAAFGIYMQAKWTGARGGTPLRAKLGVLIIDKTDGSFIGFQRALVRVLMSYVSQFVLLVGYLWMLWDKDRQTWHDKVANSVVVRRS